jgi:hypothetical protein
MILKYLILAASLFSFNGQTDTFDQENKTILLIRKTIRTEVLFLSFNLLLGVICSSVVIFSFIQMSKAFQFFLEPYEYGKLIEIASFSAIAFIGFGVFYYIFKKHTQFVLPEQKVTAKHSLINDVQKIGSKFMTGFIEGIKTNDPLKNR